MTIMTRTLTAVALVSGLALIASPYFIGGIAEKTIQTQITAFNAQSPYATITMDHYTRHWLSSSAQLVIDIHSGPNNTQATHKIIPVDMLIKHGPVFTLNQSLVFDKGAIVMHSNDAQFPGTVSYLLAWRHQFALQFNADNFSAEQSNSTIQLQKIALTTTKHAVLGAWIGTVNGSISAGSITNTNTHAAIGSFNQLTFSNETALSNDQTQLTSSLSATIQSATYLDTTASPITLNYTINNLDRVGYLNLMAATANSAPNSDLVAALTRIFESGFSIDLDKFYVGLPKNKGASPFLLTATVTFAPIPHLSSTIAQLTSGKPANLMMTAPFLAASLVSATHATIALSLPQELAHTLLKNNDAAYDYLIQNHMLLVADDATDASLKTVITFDKNGFMINGRKPMLQLPPPAKARVAQS